MEDLKEYPYTEKEESERSRMARLALEREQHAASSNLPGTAHGAYTSGHSAQCDRVDVGWLIQQRIVDLRRQADDLEALRAMLPADIERVSSQAAAALWRLLLPTR